MSTIWYISDEIESFLDKYWHSNEESFYFIGIDFFDSVGISNPQIWITTKYTIYTMFQLSEYSLTYIPTKL